MRRFLTAMALAAATAASSSAWAGPAHVLASRVLASPPAGARYAVSADLDGATRDALAKALGEAGLQVVDPGQAHGYLATVQVKAGPLCTAACSPLTGFDVGPLADHFRHIAVVAAQRNAGARMTPGVSLPWYTYLQSDGLSGRADDYLPALLSSGARAYARDTVPEGPPKLSPPVPLIPNLSSAPGA